jgi:DNA-directed RNA polymerase specialized sigma24 family protein
MKGVVKVKECPIGTIRSRLSRGRRLLGGPKGLHP